MTNHKPLGISKILIATGIYPPDLGGPATMLAALFGSLRRNGLAVKVITYSDIKNLTGEDSRAIYRITKSPKTFLRLRYLVWLLRLSFWADVIYVTETYSVGYFVYLIKRLTHKRYILRFTGDSAWEIAAGRGWTSDYIVDFQNKKYNSRIEMLKNRRRKILVNADRIIADSHFTAGLARQIGVSPERITVIHNAVDFFPPPPPRQSSVHPTLVFAGRLVPWKGLVMMLQVVADLKNRWPDIIFEVLGDGPQAAELKTLAQKLGIQDQVNFRGRVSEEASHQFFAKASVFVLNSLYEGLPHSILNAMRAGLPVIATPIGGNPEVVADGVNGWLASYNDRLAWREAIDKLLADKTLQEQFSRAGVETVTHFRWSDVERKTIEVINSLN